MESYEPRASGGARRLGRGLVAAAIAIGGLSHSGTASADAPTSYREAVLEEASLVSYWRSGERPGDPRAADRAHANPGRYANGPRRGVRGLVAG